MTKLDRRVRRFRAAGGHVSKYYKRCWIFLQKYHIFFVMLIYLIEEIIPFMTDWFICKFFEIQT